jgi:hypothetical protein
LQFDVLQFDGLQFDGLLNIMIPVSTLLLVEDCVPDRTLYRRWLQSDPNCNYSDTGKGIAPELLPKVFDRFQVRSHYPEGEIPAIALTAYASITDEERSLQVGFQRHLTKPVEPEILITEIIHLVQDTKTRHV